MNSKQKESIEECIELKKLNQKILKDFKVTVDDHKTLVHHYKVQDRIDDLINEEAGWKL